MPIKNTMQLLSGPSSGWKTASAPAMSTLSSVPPPASSRFLPVSHLSLAEGVAAAGVRG
ncbi:MAG: hypothetical protein IK099_11650 [Clostridia bacterium]|nr:hypothetical protein [Clostridia bacterium]